MLSKINRISTEMQKREVMSLIISERFRLLMTTGHNIHFRSQDVSTTSQFVDSIFFFCLFVSLVRFSQTGWKSELTCQSTNISELILIVTLCLFLSLLLKHP